MINNGGMLDGLTMAIVGQLNHERRQEQRWDILTDTFEEVLADDVRNELESTLAELLNDDTPARKAPVLSERAKAKAMAEWPKIFHGFKQRERERARKAAAPVRVVKDAEGLSYYRNGQMIGFDLTS